MNRAVETTKPKRKSQSTLLIDNNVGDQQKECAFVVGLRPPPAWCLNLVFGCARSSTCLRRMLARRSPPRGCGPFRGDGRRHRPRSPFHLRSAPNNRFPRWHDCPPSLSVHFSCLLWHLPSLVGCWREPKPKPDWLSGNTSSGTPELVACSTQAAKHRKVPPKTKQRRCEERERERGEESNGHTEEKGWSQRRERPERQKKTNRQGERQGRPGET